MRRAALLAVLAVLAVLGAACSPRAASPPVGPTQLVWVDREGHPGATLGAAHLDIRDPELAPDGSPITFTAGAAGEELWTANLETADETRLPPGAGLRTHPRGFAAGRPFVNASIRSDLDLVLIAPGSQAAILLVDEGGRHRLRVATIGANGALGPATPLLKRSVDPDVVDAALSADGTLLAYEVRGEQRSDVFVARFPSGEGDWQVSSGGGEAPRFASAAKELFYVARPDSGPPVMSAAEVYPSETPPIGLTRPFFDLASIHGLTHPTEYVVTADARRFLFAERATTPGP